MAGRNRARHDLRADVTGEYRQPYGKPREDARDGRKSREDTPFSQPKVPYSPNVGPR